MPLDPQAERVLAFLNASPRDPDQVTPEQLRAGYRALVAGRATGPELPSVEDRSVPGPDGEIPVRLYRPAANGRLPLVVYFHGGGFVLCDLETHDASCRRLARDSGCAVLSVDYRLAPEARFPAAHEDCYAATCWAAGQGDELGVDGSRLAVAGDSAGGNLAAGVALRARGSGGPALAHQLLVYPVVDQTFATEYASYRDNAEGYFLTLAMMRWFTGHYLARPQDARDPLASPLLAEKLEGLAPATILTAEYDPLRDEAELYAERLREAGVPLEHRRYDGMIHGFFAMTDLMDRAAEAAAWAAGRLRAALRP